MEETIDGNYYHVHFDSWLSFVEQASQTSTKVSSPESRKVGNPSFYGETFDEAIKLATYGWIDGANRVKETLDIINSEIPKASVKRELVFAKTGPGTLHKGRYLKGHPRPMMVWKDQETNDWSFSNNGQIVPIIFNIGASGGFSSEDAFGKGAVVCALIDQIEKSGRRVDLIIASSVSEGWGGSGDAKIDITCQLKRPNDPLDVDRISFAMANSACLRRLAWSVREQSPDSIIQSFGLSSGQYGSPRTYEGNGDSLVIGAADLSYYNPNTWKPWLAEQLKSQGIEWEYEEK